MRCLPSTTDKKGRNITTAKEIWPFLDDEDIAGFREYSIKIMQMSDGNGLLERWRNSLSPAKLKKLDKWRIKGASNDEGRIAFFYGALN